jgi:hypothetical protein
MAGLVAQHWQRGNIVLVPHLSWSPQSARMFDLGGARFPASSLIRQPELTCHRNCHRASAPLWQAPQPVAMKGAASPRPFARRSARRRVLGGGWSPPGRWGGGGGRREKRSKSKARACSGAWPGGKAGNRASVPVDAHRPRRSFRIRGRRKRPGSVVARAQLLQPGRLWKPKPIEPLSPALGLVRRRSCGSPSQRNAGLSHRIGIPCGEWTRGSARRARRAEKRRRSAPQSRAKWQLAQGGLAVGGQASFPRTARVRARLQA